MKRKRIILGLALTFLMMGGCSFRLPSNVDLTGLGAYYNEETQQWE